jgi:hypothetical protein
VIEVAPALPSWAQWVLVTIGPLAAVLAALFTGLAYRLEVKRRKDALFDLRYRFFEETWEQYKRTRRYGMSASTAYDHVVESAPKKRDFEGEFSWESYALRAEFIFSEDVAAQVRKFDEIRDEDTQQNPYQPEAIEMKEPPQAWFVEIFSDYLKVGR